MTEPPPVRSGQVGQVGIHGIVRNLEGCCCATPIYSSVARFKPRAVDISEVGLPSSAQAALCSKSSHGLRFWPSIPEGRRVHLYRRIVNESLSCPSHARPFSETTRVRNHTGRAHGSAIDFLARAWVCCMHAPNKLMQISTVGVHLSGSSKGTMRRRPVRRWSYAVDFGIYHLRDSSFRAPVG
jgi:hypothetical protein